MTLPLLALLVLPVRHVHLLDHSPALDDVDYNRHLSNSCYAKVRSSAGPGRGQEGSQAALDWAFSLAFSSVCLLQACMEAHTSPVFAEP